MRSILQNGETTVDQDQTPTRKIQEQNDCWQQDTEHILFQISYFSDFAARLQYYPEAWRPAFQIISDEIPTLPFPRLQLLYLWYDVTGENRQKREN